ncbi:MAG: SUF system NifU family Fe-S cluster assembly protein [Erysipelotrichaceae bacterium]|nr:SUF system NifU family Fe-S cluster assembly protein [Erysipelotrichaceae bacterium]
MMFDDNLKRTILLEHYQNPHNKGLSDDERYHLIHNASESCIDDIKVQMLIEEDRIKDVRFDGVGCTICFASTSIMSDLIKGKTKEEALNIINNYYNMIDEKDYDPDLLEEANAFDTLSKQANRIKCGTIGIHAMEDLIKDYDRQ